MKFTTTIAASIIALTIAGVANADERDEVTKTLDLTGFNAIDVSGVYELDIQVGPAYSIELSGTTEEMERVKTSVKNSVLHLDQERKKKRKGIRGKKHQGVNAVITMPNMTALEVSGVVDGTIAGVDASNFEVNISGVGDLEIDGKCGSFDARVSGVGDLDAKGLECKIVKVRVSGVGDANVYASDEVDARVSGMGDIDVYGSPEKVSKSDSMFAEVTIH